jgi:hypothetical protein
MVLEDDDFIQAYKPHWRFIRTHYEGTNNPFGFKSYVIRVTDPSVGYIGAILKLIHKEQKVAYRYNLQFSYILKDIETDEVKLYYHGNNSSFHDTPPLIENDQGLEKELNNYEANDILEATILQRPNTKWQLERIVGFAVKLFPIKEHLLK